MQTSRRPRAGARAAMATAMFLLTWTGAQAAGPIGSPFYSIEIEPWDPLFDAPPAARRFLVSTQDAVDGTMAGGVPLGAYVLQPAQADLSAVVTNHGHTFWADASTPVYMTLPRPTDAFIGGSVEVQVVQSYRKSAPDGWLNFTYTSAFLEIYRDVELAPPCPGCTLAEAGWRAEVRLHSDPDTPVWWQSQRATLEDVGGLLTLNVAGESPVSPLNPQWSWDCDRCGGPATRLGRALLDGPYTGLVDLSGIPYDDSLSPDAQPEFTVTYTLWAIAYDEALFSGARAFARDPLGGDTGVSFELAGLVPTDAPVGVIPEPGRWLTMLLGLGVLLWYRRAGRPQRNATATPGDRRGFVR